MVGNIGSLVWRAARRWPDRLAIVDGETEISYAALAARAGAHAERLRDAGTQPGDRVALLFGRTWDAAAALFGTLGAGAVAVVVADVLRARQVEHVVRHSGARVLLVGAGVPPVDQLSVPAARLAAGPPEPGPRGAAGAVPGEVAGRREGDLAQLIYTSGSTGRPKGVMVSHGNLWAGVDAVGSYLGVRREDRLASLLPFSFDYGLNQLLLAVAAGATLVIERSPVAARVDDGLRRGRVTVAAGVPALWHQLLAVERFRREPIDTLRCLTNSGGHLAEEAVRALRAGQPQADLYLMYGLTEAFRSTYLDPRRVEAKPRSVGRAIPGADVRVVRPDGTPCPPWEVGEITHRGPTVALGYWNDPGATADVFRPGPRPGERVVHSGDLGWIDDGGDLHICGRRDGMIKRLGFRVSPDEVTEALFASGLVRAACVTSSPGGGPEGAEIVGHVVLRPGAALADLERHAARELPRHMCPSRLLSHSALPRTPNGKYDLAALAERAGVGGGDEANGAAARVAAPAGGAP